MKMDPYECENSIGKACKEHQSRLSTEWPTVCLASIEIVFVYSNISPLLDQSSLSWISLLWSSQFQVGGIDRGFSSSKVSLPIFLFCMDGWVSIRFGNTIYQMILPRLLVVTVMKEIWMVQGMRVELFSSNLTFHSLDNLIKTILIIFLVVKGGMP